jgi:hypothetical protein
MIYLCFEVECTISGYRICDPSYSIRPKTLFGSVLEHFANVRHVKGFKTCVSGLHPLFRGTDVAKHRFDYIGLKMIGSVSEHFANLQHIERCNTCVSRLHVLFRGTEVAKHPFFYIGQKWCLGVFQSISLTFSAYKDAILVFRAWMHYFGVPKLRCIHSTLVDPKWCLGAFETISITFGCKEMQNLCFGHECTILGYRS